MAKVKGKYTQGGLQYKEGSTILLEIAQKANGGVKGDGLSIVAYQGEWYVLNNTNVTLA